MRDRFICVLCWLGIFLSGTGIASIVIATRVHGEIIKPFSVAPSGMDPLPVCWDLQDSFDISVGILAKESVWKAKVDEGKCAIISFPWFYHRTVFRNQHFRVAEVRVQNDGWHTMYAVFGTLPPTVEA